MLHDTIVCPNAKKQLNKNKKIFSHLTPSISLEVLCELHKMNKTYNLIQCSAQGFKRAGRQFSKRAFSARC